jgi:hypothetical protein
LSKDAVQPIVQLVYAVYASVLFRSSASSEVTGSKDAGDEGAFHTHVLRLRQSAAPLRMLEPFSKELVACFRDLPVTTVPNLKF